MGYQRTPIVSLSCTDTDGIINLLGVQRFSLRFEASMFPSRTLAPALERYEFYLNPDTRLHPFQTISTASLTTLRLSGNVDLLPFTHFPSLRTLTLFGIKGPFFDMRGPAVFFAETNLYSFAYAQRDRNCYELRDDHLQSLAELAPGLTHLVLLQCAHLSSRGLADGLRKLPFLQYVAISLVLVDELNTDFIEALPLTINTFKLQFKHGRWAPPLWDEQSMILDSIETHLLSRERAPDAIWISMSDDVLLEGGRLARWRALARSRRVLLTVGVWEQSEII
jgi:hypothetical protein